MSLRYFTKQKLIALIITMVMVVSTIYFNLYYLKDDYESAQTSSDRCFTELTSIKYQLNEIMEYKNRIDKLLTETQKKHEADKERFKDIMDTCVAMKQQAVICQSQFEDLQSECMKVKEDFEKVKSNNNGKESEKFR